MKIKKRNKRSRLRGRRRCGYGFGKKHRGKGSKGGKGMAGTGKKAGQKLTWVQAKAPDYFGKHGFTSMKKLSSGIQIINLFQVQDNHKRLIKEGKGKKTPQGIELSLESYKILGEGEVKDKFIINAAAASKSAISKVEKAGGKVL